MEKYGLHDRQRRLLYVLNCGHGVMTGNDLAGKLGISERTVRSDIGAINEAMAAYKLEIVATRGKGYVLKVGNRKVFHELFSDRDTIVTREDRIKYLILHLVRADGWCELPELEDDMFVSRTTLENDLREVKQRITCNEPYIGVIRDGSRIKLEDDEEKRRNIMVRIYSENWDYDSRDGIMLKDQTMTPKALDQLRRLWKSVLRKNRLELDDFGLIYMIMASAVAHMRLLAGHRLEQGSFACSGETAPMTRAIQSAVQMFWMRIEPEWGLKASPGEYSWMAYILKQLLILNFCRENKADMAQMTDKRCRDFAKTLLTEIKAVYSLDFGEDALFCTDIILHIQALINSMVSVQTQSGYLMDELRLSYPFLGEVVRYFCRRLESLSGVPMSRDDEDYILPLFIGVYNRIARERTRGRIRAVLVSHLNYGLSYSLLDDIRVRFGQQMEILGPFPIYDRKHIDALNPSLIITTARMDAFRKYPIPVLTVSPLMEEGAQRNIEQCLRALVNEKMFPDPPRGVDYFRHKKLELTLTRRMELPQILALLEENLRVNLLLSEYLTIRWEDCSYSLLSNECLFVYMSGAHGQDTVMSVASCKYMTTWRQCRTIRKVLFMIINENEMAYLGSFYRLMMEEKHE